MRLLEPVGLAGQLTPKILTDQLTLSLVDADYALRINTRPPGSQEIYLRSAPACENGMMVIVFQSVGLTVLGFGGHP